MNNQMDWKWFDFLPQRIAANGLCSSWKLVMSAAVLSLGTCPFNMLVSEVGKVMDCLLMKLARTPNHWFGQWRWFCYSQGKGCHLETLRLGWSRQTRTPKIQQGHMQRPACKKACPYPCSDADQGLTAWGAVLLKRSVEILVDSKQDISQQCVLTAKAQHWAV